MLHPYQDATRTVDERASDLLGRMTFEEKQPRCTPCG